MKLQPASKGYAIAGRWRRANKQLTRLTTAICWYLASLLHERLAQRQTPIRRQSCEFFAVLPLATAAAAAAAEVFSGQALGVVHKVIIGRQTDLV